MVRQLKQLVDGIDQDCDGWDLTDVDGDGYDEYPDFEVKNSKGNEIEFGSIGGGGRYDNLIDNSLRSTIINGYHNHISGMYNCTVVGDYIGTTPITPVMHNSFHVGCYNGLHCYGDVVSFAASDERLKDNISAINDPLDKVMSLDAVQFDWNSNQETHVGHDIGLIAQQVESVAPEIVSERMDGYKGVKYEKVVPLLVGAIKEQQKRIDSLEEKIRSLESNH